MAAEFRQRTPGEYVKLLWRRKFMILLPALAVFCAVAWVVWFLPNKYESTTQLLIKPPTIPNVDVKPLAEDDLALRLNNITQILQSRSSLEPLITKYNLYKEERERGIQMESVIEKMRKNITVTVEKTGETETKLPSFKITFRGNDPTSTRDVTAALASMYVNEQTKSIAEDAGNAKKFFEDQLAKAQRDLDSVEQRRLDYMKANSSRLPETANSLIAQLEGLRMQQQALIEAMARSRDSKTRITSQKADYEELAKQDITDAVDQNSVINSPAYSELLNKKANIEAELANMKRLLTDKNPEVIAKENELAATERAIKLLDDKQQAKLERFKQGQENRAKVRSNSLDLDMQSIENELVRQDAALKDNQNQIAEIESKLNSIPEAQVAIEGFNQELSSARILFNQMLENKNKIEIAFKAQIEQKGALVQVIDPANLPRTPVAPKRLILFGLGLGLGICVGLLFAGLFEIPRLFTIQNVEDAAHYTKLPVLASVPEVLTPQEAIWKPRRQLVGLAFGIALTLASIPVLAIALTMTRVFDRFVA